MVNRTTSRTERTNVEYPLWRKKVDNSIFRDAGTTIPNWACDLWNFDTLYPMDLGKRELGGKDEFRFHKQDWRPRKDYEAELGAENVIYTLIDTKNKLLYAGEAQKLIQRFNQGHKPIPHWDSYRYDQLPPMQKRTRVAAERMVIRPFGAVLPNKRDISSIELIECRLANEKIETRGMVDLVASLVVATLSIVAFFSADDTSRGTIISTIYMGRFSI